MVYKTKTNKTHKENHNAICVGHHYTQTNTNNIDMTAPSYKQQEAKINRTSLLCGNRSGHHNAELRT